MRAKETQRDKLILLGKKIRNFTLSVRNEIRYSRIDQ